MRKEQIQKRIGLGLAITLVWAMAGPEPAMADQTGPMPSIEDKVVAGPAVTSHAHQAVVPFTTHSVTEAQRLATEQQYGISILGVRMTAAGHMLDFRYRVLDTTKAGRLIRPKMGLALIDQASKTEMPVPVMDKVGALKQTRSHLFPDRTYSVIFANRGGILKAGSKVSIQFGDLTLDNLIVE
jgi:hypothetical protein